MKTTIAILLAALFPALAMAAGDHGAHGAMPAHTSVPDAAMMPVHPRPIRSVAATRPASTE